MSATPTSAATAREVLITREFNAPRELVFKAWTDTEHLDRWFAPQGCGIRFVKLDFREGGEFHSCILTPDGKECWARGEYREMTPPQRIVMTMNAADAAGNLVQPADVGMDPDWPAESVVTIDFSDNGGKTTITLHQTVSEELAKKTGAHPSWLSMLDRLEAIVSQ